MLVALLGAHQPIFVFDLAFDIFVNYLFIIARIKQTSSRTKFLALTPRTQLLNCFLVHSGVLSLAFTHKVRQELLVNMRVYFAVLLAFLLNSLILEYSTFFHFIFKFPRPVCLKFARGAYYLDFVISARMLRIKVRSWVQFLRVILRELLQILHIGNLLAIGRSLQQEKSL